MQSLRLGNGDGRGSLISKRFALPERFPFDTSDGNFSIANDLQVMAAARGSAFERNAGERASERAKSRGSRLSREKSVKRGAAAETGAVSSRAAQAIEAQGDSVTDAKAGTLSASTSGGSIYLYSITGVLLAEYSRINGFFQPVKDYIYVGKKLLAEYRHTENQTYFYQQDQINSTRVVTDEAGTVVYSAAHDPFGGIQQTWVNTFDPAPKFSGKERDGESGLDYFGARYYDRAQYRFVSVDKRIYYQDASRNPQKWNLYSYCWNNPSSYFDPSGNYGISIHFNFTYQIGIAIGMAPRLALGIAFYNSWVDYSFATTAGAGTRDPMNFGKMIAATVFNAITGVIAKWHIPSEQRIEECRRIATTTYDPKEFGKALHVLQDSFSHAGLSPVFGHALEPGRDNPCLYQEEAGAMGMMTLDLMSDFLHRWNLLMDAVSSLLSSLAVVLTILP